MSTITENDYLKRLPDNGSTRFANIVVNYTQNQQNQQKSNSANINTFASNYGQPQHGNNAIHSLFDQEKASITFQNNQLSRTSMNDSNVMQNHQQGLSADSFFQPNISPYTQQQYSQYEPEIFSNNPTQHLFRNMNKRTIPTTIVKRSTKGQNSESRLNGQGDDSLLGPNSKLSGYNQKNYSAANQNRLENKNHVNSNIFASSGQNEFGFGDRTEAPPTTSIQDWKREDEFGYIPENSSVFYESNSNFEYRDTISSTRNDHKKVPNAFDKEQLDFNKSSLHYSDGASGVNSACKIKLSTNSPHIEEGAVIIFGYPESISNSIITHFSHYGKIMENFQVLRNPASINLSAIKLYNHMDGKEITRHHKIYPIYTGDGWAKLTYASTSSAIRALKENGTVFEGALIGCIPYTKEAVEMLISNKVSNHENIGELNTSGNINIKPLSLSSMEGDCKTENGISSDAPVFEHSNLRRLDIKDGKSLFLHSSSAYNHNFLQNLESKMRHQQENTSEQDLRSGLWDRLTNWLFGWNDV